MGEIKSRLSQPATTPAIAKEPERLKFRTLVGWIEYGEIPYPIRYTLKAPTSELVSKKAPGDYRQIPYIGRDWAISISVHRSVPPQYRDIVMFHELREANLVHGHNMKKKEADKIAIVETDNYARKHLTPEEYAEFIEWRGSLDIKI